MSFRKYMTHCVVECQDCEWGTEDYENGQRQASEHARKHGHTVKAEVAYCCVYSGAGRKK